MNWTLFQYSMWDQKKISNSSLAIQSENITFIYIIVHLWADKTIKSK